MEKLKGKSKLIIIITIVAVVAIVGIVIGIVAGGNKEKREVSSGSAEQQKMTKDEMIKIAKTFNTVEASDAVKANAKNAKEIYNDNVFLFTCKVRSVEDTFVEVTAKNTIAWIRIALSDEELSSLSKDQTIKVVGKIERFGRYSGDTTGESYTFGMEEAYLVSVDK